MKRIIIGLTAALALVLVGTARADDTKSTESKSTTQKTETKDTTAPYTQDTAKDGMGGSGATSTTTKSEKKTTTKDKDTKADDTTKAAPAK
jgi:hypothetical protein